MTRFLTASSVLLAGSALAFAAVTSNNSPALSQVRRPSASQQPSTQSRGAKPSYAWRQYGRTKRLISYNTSIQHVVVIDMENRSFDNLLAGYYGSSYRGGPQHWQDVMNLYNFRNPNQPLTPNPLSTAVPYGFDPHHGHDDGWIVETTLGFGAEGFGCATKTCPSNATAFSYVPISNTGPYAQLIQNFASADEVFQANEGPSMPSHQYLIAGQSGGIAGSKTAYQAESENPSASGAPSPPQLGNTIEIEDPSGGGVAYCSPQSPSQVQSLNMINSAPEKSAGNAVIAPPCETYANGTILDELVGTFGTPPYFDWQYIASQVGGFWAAPTAVQNLYAQWNSNPYGAMQPFAVDQNAYNFVQSLNNAGNPQRPFAAVTYITPCLNTSDHPTATGVVDYGPQWLGSVVNAIGTAQSGSLWTHTAIIVTWDDWGGWFDHVSPLEAYPNAYPNGGGPPPNPADPNEWGFRVPFLLISPYVNYAGYVSHGLNGTLTHPIARSQSAVLDFIETIYGLRSLKADDAYSNDNLLEMFNFNNKPLPFTPVTGLGTYQIPSHC